MEELRRRATSNVEFLGRLEDHELVTAMQGCRAGLFPSIDDFGLVPLEVNACGRPVLAAKGGGALHTVEPGISGEFLEEQSVDAIVKAVRGFEPRRWLPEAIRDHALARDGRQFRRHLRAVAEITARTVRS
jgi:glycosyltransferase involved in cell wall biosynthesis